MMIRRNEDTTSPIIHSLELMRSLAPTSRKIIMWCSAITIGGLVIGAKVPGIDYKIMMPISALDVFMSIFIWAYNCEFMHRYQLRLGEHAAYLEDDDIRSYYEDDYIKSDKYISQRLLAACQCEQVPDQVGALIYATGRYRGYMMNEQNIEDYNNLVDQYHELEKRRDELDTQCDEIGDQLRLANDEIIKLNGLLESSRKRCAEIARERDSAQAQYHEVLNTYEMETCGYKVSENEREFEAIQEAQREIEAMPAGLAEMTGRTVAAVMTEQGNADLIPDQASAKNSKFAQFTEAQLKHIVFLIENSSLTQREIADKFGTDQPTISKIKREYAA